MVTIEAITRASMQERGQYNLMKNSSEQSPCRRQMALGDYFSSKATLQSVEEVLGGAQRCELYSTHN